MRFRLMFWIDVTGQSVMRGGMDGTNITTIHNDTAMSFGLAIDTEGIMLTKTNVPMHSISYNIVCAPSNRAVLPECLHSTL